jgi:hypothetical protein
MIYKRKPIVLDLISHLTRLPVKRKRKKEKIAQLKQMKQFDEKFFEVAKNHRFSRWHLFSLIY